LVKLKGEHHNRDGERADDEIEDVVAGHCQSNEPLGIFWIRH
jgi:hypothetical protein